MNPNRMSWPELAVRLRLVVDAMPTRARLLRFQFPFWAVLALVFMAAAGVSGWLVLTLVLALVGTVHTAVEIWVLALNDDNFEWEEHTGP